MATPRTLPQRLALLSNLVTDAAGFLPPLIARIGVGWVFAESGWGKLGNLEKVTGFFKSLNIPFPEIQAPMVSGLELVCGVLLILGLGTRFAALILTGIMAVALITAKSSEITGVPELFALSEALYIVLFLWLAAQGAGLISVDTVIAKMLGIDRETLDGSTKN